MGYAWCPLPLQLQCTSNSFCKDSQKMLNLGNSEIHGTLATESLSTMLEPTAVIHSLDNQYLAKMDVPCNHSTPHSDCTASFCSYLIHCTTC